MPPRPLFLAHAEQLLTLAGRPIPRRGPDLSHLGIQVDGAVLVRGGRIIQAGRTRGLEAEARKLGARVIDCRGRVVMPGFIDSHTHLLFAGSRTADFEQRLCGRTYEEIAAAGGGIRLTARLLRDTGDEELIAHANRFLAELAAHGTTTVEVKTGYGLNAAQERRTLLVIDRLRQQSALEIVPTVLAAHTVPRGYQNRSAEYVDLVTRTLVPFAASQRLAEFIDCFCDNTAFTLKDCRRVLQSGLAHGLAPRIHAEQLSHTGATLLATRLGAVSADHLDHITALDVRALASSGTVASLVPGANFFLGGREYPPARRLIEAGAAVALASDFNPGTSPTLNMQFILTLACTAMQMTPAEAIAAATINAAYSLRRSHRLGSIEAGKDADLVVLDVDDYRKIPYYFAWNHCVLTIKRGRIIYADRTKCNPGSE
jgi:imidazolonepropionase